ncbi:putative lipid II flippase FtsW [Soehngenia longivitae]|uniref:Probable peptidoglycan glycosyltransferase FtsW n=1 Tax=Soehngenia longivitae TaxID=2562294 RepID=A0A4Z0D5K8_9FIRM|nr:putative lipid II flippase FtsW [Soehngenia longivitae]TFZ40094.1 putative lipid II flippase FtsW [Soehngenia longivitae]
MKSKLLKHEPDFYILISTIMLVFIGVIMVYSASSPKALQEFGDPLFFFKRQIVWAALGLFIMIILMNIDYHIWKKHATAIYIITIILGLLIFTPLGMELKGARRWINLGFTTFMPSDAIKLGSIIFYAAFLENKKDKVSKLKDGLIPAFILIGISTGLVYLQKDLSTSITVAGTMLSMYFIAGMPYYVLIASAGLTAILFKVAVYSEGNEYRLDRIKSFRDPFADKLGDGYQIVQSLYALGSGGLFGVGLGKSKQKFFYIPEAYNDFIFSIIGEELGLVGTTFILSLYVIIIFRAFHVARNSNDKFALFLASGIASLIAIQSLMNIAVVTSSIPPTGINLPFVSSGGTSLIFYLASIGILLNISRYTKTDGSKKNEHNS